MVETYIKYITVINGAIFFLAANILIYKTRRASSSSIKNIFWAFTAFCVMKSMSLLSAAPLKIFPANEIMLEKNMLLTIILNVITGLSLVISNVFLFHFGISMATYKMSVRIDFKVFPVILFVAYLIMYFTKMMSPQDIEKISLYGFAFSGTFLGSIGCFNLYQIKKTSRDKKLLSGLIICGVSLIFYSMVEGIVTKPVLGSAAELLRLLTAAALFVASLFMTALLKEEKERKIGYI